MGILIYWREYAARDHVSLLHVLLWQLLIWLPWGFGFEGLERIVDKFKGRKHGKPLAFTVGLFWVLVHFGWFFVISSSISPYLEFSESRFGVYRYFFIFWTLIDLGLLWFVVDKLWSIEGEHGPSPVLLELTRGSKTYFCEPDQVHWLVSENYYTKISTDSGVFVMRRLLKTFLDILPSELFKKIHRSTIVNVAYVTELEGNSSQGFELVLKDGTKHRVSRSFSKEILLFFKGRAQ